jgi:transcription elongation factor GreA
MPYYFLRDDFEKLNRHIETVSGRIRDIGQDMGESCREGAETYHDNFGYEEGERSQKMWSTHLQELLSINRNAAIVDEQGPLEQVGIGSRVTIRDLRTGAQRCVQIGSYRVYDGSERISYNSPLGRILLGAQEGDIVSGDIAGSERKFEIVSIS